MSSSTPRSTQPSTQQAMRGAPQGRRANFPDLPDDLIKRVSRGEIDAFETLYEEIAPSVYGLARRVLRDASLAEDVTQDVLAWVWREASRFDPAKGSVRTWILTITHRRAVDRVRSEAARRKRDLAQLDTPHDSTVECATDSLDRADAQRRVAACMHALTEPQRIAVSMAYFGGHTYREVARLLNVNESTLRTRIRAGLQRMRLALEAESLTALRPQRT